MNKALLIALCGTFLGGSAIAKTARPVFVAFEFRAASATNNTKPEELRELERRISEHLAEKFWKQCPYWTILPLNQSPKVGDPILRIWLTEDTSASAIQSGEWRLNMMLERQARPPNRQHQWDDLLFPAGEFSRLVGILDGNLWLQTIDRKFHTGLLKSHGESVLEALKAVVPLGEGIVFTDPPPNGNDHIVLPLAWEQYGEQLGSSEFVIRCMRPTGVVVTLRARGMGRPEMFTPRNPQFPGLLVQLLEWDKESIAQHIADLPALTQSVFLLKQPIASGDALMAQ